MDGITHRTGAKTKHTETIPLLRRRWPWGTKFIKVVNDSNLDVVLFFVHENRPQLKGQEKTTERGANASASAGGGLDNFVEGKAGLRFSYKEVNKMFFEAGDCVVDERKLHVGENCKVHFLPGCKELRVRGYYVLPIDDPKPLAFWKNSVYSRSVRITATVKKDRSMGVPKEVEVGRLEQLPLRRYCTARTVNFCFPNVQTKGRMNFGEGRTVRRSSPDLSETGCCLSEKCSTFHLST